jgi:hypothetical protein
MKNNFEIDTDMTKRITSSCFICEKETVFVDLQRLVFCCNKWECFSLLVNKMPLEADLVIDKTSEIRKKPKIMCPLSSDQKCHKAGLSLLKKIFNAYAERGMQIDKIALKQLIRDANADENIYCCSKEQNVKDKYTEKELIQCFLLHKALYRHLSVDAKAMYASLIELLETINRHLGEQNVVIVTILNDFDQWKQKRTFTIK